MTTKRYLGDGVYVDADEARGLVLTAENGIVATDTIVLEPEVWAALMQFVRLLVTDGEIARKANNDRGRTITNLAPPEIGTPIPGYFRDDGTQGEELSGIPNGFREHVEKVARGDADIETLLPNWTYIRRMLT